jgi:ATP-binding cassette subfamily F protein uup
MVVALDGEGNCETIVGGWSDWAAYNKEKLAAARQAKSGKSNAGAKIATYENAKAKAAKLSYKDARELAELPARLETLAAAIARHEAVLADATLYSRDPKRFANVMAELEKVRADLAAAEERWLALAEMEAALSA